MAGFVVDIWIAFLIRTALNVFKKLRGTGWPLSNGTIAGYSYVRPDIGCDYGEYRYTYSANGRALEGLYVVPYFMSRSSKAQISQSIGTIVRVAVDPGNPTRSILKGF